MRLGPFAFHVHSLAYRQLGREDRWRWAQLDLLGSQSVLHYIGKGASRLQFSGTLYPLMDLGGIRTGGRHIDEVRAIADAGTPLILVTGVGEVLGRWVIQKINSNQSFFLQDGQARKDEYTIELSSYGGVRPQSQAYDPEINEMLAARQEDEQQVATIFGTDVTVPATDFIDTVEPTGETMLAEADPDTVPETDIDDFGGVGPALEQRTLAGAPSLYETYRNAALSRGGPRLDPETLAIREDMQQAGIVFEPGNNAGSAPVSGNEQPITLGGFVAGLN